MKETIPEDWESVPLGEHCYIKARIGWRGLKASEYTSEGACLIANKHLTLYGVDWRLCDHISEFRYEESPEIQLQKDDIVMSKDGTIGQVSYIDKLPGKATINSTMMLLRSNKETINSRYLFYFLQGSDFKLFLYQKNSGSSIPHIFQRDMVNLSVTCPPLPEQKRIAEVLSTIDNAIQRADEVINGTERLKQGLMQKLLTEGIGHTEFIDSPVGEIPKKWDVVQLKDISLRTHLTDPRKAKDKEFQYVDISSIDNIAFSIVSWNTITGQNAPSRARKVIQTGDILFATTRPYLKNIAIVPSSLNGEVCSTGFCVIRANTSETTTEWIYHNVLTPQFLTKIKVKMKGATYPAVSDKDVMNVTIAKPMLEEQKRISEILSTVDRKSDLERERKSRLERIKLGLMNDLLTGRKRVNVGG